MKLPKEFFHLQLRFAEHIARVFHISLAEALLKYSTFYMRFQLGRSFDPTHPIWQEYLAGLHTAVDDVEWTHTFYLQKYTEEQQINHFGCFNYTYISDAKMIRLHFTNRDISGYSALSKERMGVRLQELATLFTNVHELHPEAVVVRGCSWLYNIQAYRRLFPPEYTQHTEVTIDKEFPFMALWGQFLNRHEQLREPMTSDFLNCVIKQATFASIKHCFPYLPLVPQCSVSHFYTFYKII